MLDNSHLGTTPAKSPERQIYVLVSWVLGVTAIFEGGEQIKSSRASCQKVCTLFCRRGERLKAFTWMRRGIVHHKNGWVAGRKVQVFATIFQSTWNTLQQPPKTEASLNFFDSMVVENPAVPITLLWRVTLRCSSFPDYLKKKQWTIKANYGGPSHTSFFSGGNNCLQGWGK